MTIQTIIEKTLDAIGNHCRRHGDVYISPKNMGIFVNYLENCNDISNITIIPYLINIEDDALYELLYYDFRIEVLDIPKSYFAEYAKGNVLPQEITRVCSH